jgi:hypothetical protein
VSIGESLCAFSLSFFLSFFSCRLTSFDVEADRRNRRHDLAQLQLVQNRRFAGCVESDHLLCDTRVSDLPCIASAHLFSSLLFSSLLFSSLLFSLSPKCGTLMCPAEI